MGRASARTSLPAAGGLRVLVAANSFALRPSPRRNHDLQPSSTPHACPHVPDPRTRRPPAGRAALGGGAGAAARRRVRDPGAARRAGSLVRDPGSGGAGRRHRRRGAGGRGHPRCRGAQHGRWQPGRAAGAVGAHREAAAGVDGHARHPAPAGRCAAAAAGGAGAGPLRGGGTARRARCARGAGGGAGRRRGGLADRGDVRGRTPRLVLLCGRDHGDAVGHLHRHAAGAPPARLRGPMRNAPHPPHAGDGKAARLGQRRRQSRVVDAGPQARLRPRG
jgi:hypothetical protein